MLGFLFSLYIFRTSGTVFSVVGRWLKCFTADGASLGDVIPKDFRFERLAPLVLQYNVPEEFTDDGVRYALDTYTLVSVIQQDAVALIIVAAHVSNESVGSSPLPWCHSGKRTVWFAFDGWQGFDIDVWFLLSDIACLYSFCYYLYAYNSRIYLFCR